MKINISKAIVEKRGVNFTLIISKENIPIEVLSSLFGKYAVKVTNIGLGQYTFEGLYDLDNIFNTLESISSYSWEETVIEI